MPKYSRHTLDTFNNEMFAAPVEAEAKRFEKVLNTYGHKHVRFVVDKYVKEGIARTGTEMQDVLRVAQATFGGPRMIALDVSAALRFATYTAIVRVERPYMDHIWPDETIGEEVPAVTEEAPLPEN